MTARASARSARRQNSTPSRPTLRSSGSTPATRGPAAKLPRRPPPAPRPEIDPDPGEQWARTVARLARDAGVDAARLVDEHQRRSDARRYLGDDPDTANAVAYEHIAEQLGRMEAA